MELNIGAKIKQLRLSLSLTQGELGDRCELTKGYISQLENNLTSPSIETLRDILSALGTNLSAFFAPERVDRIVFGESDYIAKTTDGHTMKWLVPNSQKNEMEPIIFELLPGVSSYDDMPHEGEEFGYVLSGRGLLHHGDRVQKLKTGDSFYFVADKIHFLENNGDKTLKIIWVSSPPNF